MATPLDRLNTISALCASTTAQRKGSKLGKGLAIFFGGLVDPGGLAGGIYAFWNQKPRR